MARKIILKIDTKVDLTKALQRLAAIDLRAKNFKPVYSDAKDFLEKANAANFAVGGLPSGGWKPRKDAYAWPIMKKTGRLFNSLTNMSGPPNTVTPTGAHIFGTNVEYAKFHQYGSFDRSLPKRQIIFNPTGFSELMGRKAASWVARGVT